MFYMIAKQTRRWGECRLYHNLINGKPFKAWYMVKHTKLKSKSAPIQINVLAFDSSFTLEDMI